MTKKYPVLFLLAAFVFLLGFVRPAHAESDLDFTLVNRTGYALKAVYIGPTSSDDWGDNILKRPLKNSEKLEVSFHPKASASKWDIKVTYEEDDSEVQWVGYKLKDISKITLFYDHDKDKTTAEVE